MGPIDLYATEKHYLDHLWPIWAGLAPEERGTFWVAGMLEHQPPLGARVGYPPPRGGPVMVASWKDEHTVGLARRPVVYVEHGAGQAYRGDEHAAARDNPGYSGSPGHDGVILFLCPNEVVAGRWRAAYPGVPAVAVGCPKLDGMAQVRAGRPRRQADAGTGDVSDGEHGPGAPTVVVSFHADSPLCMETRSAFRYYEPGLPGFMTAMRAAGVRVVGHAHPRLWNTLCPIWKAVGARAVFDQAEALADADVLVVDNSSALYEAAALGIAVVALNADFYRRHINHGLRFWDLIPGPQVDYPADLAPTVLDLLAFDGWADRREEVSDAVYVHRDGSSVAAAVAALRAHLPSPVPADSLT